MRFNALREAERKARLDKDLAADYITERIDYFYNQNQEYPIFIVIDRMKAGQGRTAASSSCNTCQSCP